MPRPRTKVRGYTKLFLLHAAKPCKAYHDESWLSLHRIGTVPRALIVSTVLFWYSDVSLLDRRVRFDYPEHAPGVELLPMERTSCCGANGCFEVSPHQHRKRVSLRRFRIGKHPASRPLGIILCTSAATIVGFVTSEVTW